MPEIKPIGMVTCSWCNGTGSVSVDCDTVIPNVHYEDNCPVCNGSCYVEDAPGELNDAQLMQIDTLHNGIFELMQAITHGTIEWEMEWIAPLADAITKTAINLTGKTWMQIYPYIDTDPDPDHHPEDGDWLMDQTQDL